MIRRLLPFLPLVLGLALAALWQSGLWPNPVLYVRADAGTLLFLAGLAASSLWWLGRFVGTRATRRCEQALARERTEQVEARRRFLRRLDHELKNPITAIRAGLANVADSSDGPALSGVRVQVDRLAHLSADLRKLADLEAQSLEQEPVNLERLLTELVEMMRERPGAAERRIALALPRAPWPPPPVAGDRDLLFLALHNLADNALKFSLAGDAVEVRAFEDERGAWVTVEVADTGPGIPDEDLPHLGEELYRGSAARGVEGSGLGLALAQAIITRHGGSMSVRSRVGQGTVVAVRLPVSR